MFSTSEKQKQIMINTNVGQFVLPFIHQSINKTIFSCIHEKVTGIQLSLPHVTKN